MIYIYISGSGISKKDKYGINAMDFVYTFVLIYMYMCVYIYIMYMTYIYMI